jgi:acyl-CoA reductase-like NAD-dependent aldehyde dehydrogenase
VTLPFQDARILADGARARALELGKALSIAATKGGYTLKRDGATLGGIGISGGARTRTSRSARTMVQTLISVKPGHSLRCDEVSGGVMAVRLAARYNEAVGLANDCDYGLSAAAVRFAS